MLIQGSKLDDFKTERKDLMPPLPMPYRLVPLLFYLSLLFLGVVGSVAMWTSQVSIKRFEGITLQTNRLKKEISATKAARSALEQKIREATDMEDWVLASMPLQLLIVGIVRSIEPGANIVDLSLERDEDTPSQLKLALTLNAASDGQIEKTLEAVRKLDYREFSPTQSTIKGNFEYQASLLWSNPKSKIQTPQDRVKAIKTP